MLVAHYQLKPYIAKVAIRGENKYHGKVPLVQLYPPKYMDAMRSRTFIYYYVYPY